MPVREDTPSIADDDLLWRRIVNTPVFFKREGESYRLSSAAFLDDHTGEVSVHLEKIIKAQEKALAGRPDDGLVEIAAQVPRSQGHLVVADPTENDASHAVICPPRELSKKGRRKAAKVMANRARWLVLPLQLRDHPMLR
jgi:hypothetical protein